ncbi:13656_t:CDS:10, partial [Funneliformis mosseae]
MHLSFECLEDLKYLVFWEQSKEPSLMKFLNFRLLAQDLEDEHYAEISDVGQKVIKWLKDHSFITIYSSLYLSGVGVGKTPGKNDKNSKQINHFWDLQAKSQNIHAEKKLLEEEAQLSQTQYILDATRERSLLQRTITNQFEFNVWLSRKRLLTSQVLLQIKTVNSDEVPSATTTTSLYVPSSPSTPDCNISEEYIIVENRSYSMDYLTGPGVPEWHLNEDSIRWIVNDIDITEICREYRAIVVKKCESMEVTLSATEELIISHVFVFQEQSPLGLCEYFDDELWAELFAEFRGTFQFSVFSSNSEYLQIPCEEQNQTERQKLARHYLRNFEVITEEEEIIIEMFRELVDNEQSSFTRNYV